MSMLEEALKYRELGFPIFPVAIWRAPGEERDEKKPMVKWKKYQTELPTVEEVKAWWSRWPNAFIGMATGELTGFTVLDVDVGADPKEFPLEGVKTPQVLTPSGGSHYYFAYDPDVTIDAGIAEHYDIRGQGGYVVLPPSAQSTGKRYEWFQDISIKPAPLPLEVKRAYLEHGRRKSSSAPTGNVYEDISKDWSKAALQKVPSGTRNTAMASYAGRLLGTTREKDWSSIVLPSMKNFNYAQFDPALSDSEVESIFTSISSIESQRRASGDAIGDATVSVENDTYTVYIPISDGGAVFTFIDPEHDDGEIKATLETFTEVAGIKSRPYRIGINVSSQNSRSNYVTGLNACFGKEKSAGGVRWAIVLSDACKAFEDTFNASLDKELMFADSIVEEPTRYLIEPFIEDKSINLYFGNRASMKTYITIQLMMSYVSGLPFAGHLPARTGKALFLDYESNGGKFKNRVRRLGEEMAGWKDEYLSRLGYLRAAGRPVGQIVKTLKKMVYQNGIDLVVIDSAAKASSGAVEESRTATQLSSALDKLGLTYVIIGHVPKGDEKQENIFGSSYYMNDARSAWNVQKTVDPSDPSKSTLILYHRKTNNDMLQPPVALRASFSGKDGGVSIVSAPDSVYNVGSLPLAKRILTYFAAKGSPVSISMVSENMTDVSASSVKARMADLEREGQIARVERGLYVLASKAPTPYYAVEREGEEEIDTEKAFSMGG